MAKLTNTQITLIVVGSIVTIGAIGVGGYYAGWFTKGVKPKQESANKNTTSTVTTPPAATPTASAKKKIDATAVANASLKIGQAVVDSNIWSLFSKKTTTPTPSTTTLSAQGEPINDAALRIAENGALVGLY